MKPIGGGLSSAMNTSLNTIRNVETEMANVAHNVAAAVTHTPDQPVSEIASEITRLPELRTQAAASVKVANKAEDLLDELGSLLLKR